MVIIKQTSAFMSWESKLKDKRARAAIAARIFRLANGLPGDVRPVGYGINEMRIHYGPGYRVYFIQEEQRIIVLLCGGSKGSQRRDIEAAQKLAEVIRGGDFQ